MTVLGTWPSDRYYLSWMCQRLANRAPEEALARQCPFSVFQQLTNPPACDLQTMNQQLIEERNNIFLSSADINLIDKLYQIQLGTGMEFTSTESPDGLPIYTLPSVYATIGGSEYQLTVAKQNNIESLWYTALPSRVEDGEESYAYEEVVPRTEVSDLASTTPNDLTFYGHLYVTVRGNTTWEYRARTKIYYPKIYITGTTRKRTVTTEAVPIRYNGTFKTVNQWRSVDSVFVSYMDDSAEITIEVLPFDCESTLDNRNLIVPANGVESFRFLKLDTQSWGSTLVSEGFLVEDIETVQLGLETKDTEYEIELLDTSGQNVDLIGAAWKPNTDYMFAIDSTKLYVYDIRLPYPDLTVVEQESPDTKMDLWSDRWVYVRDSSAIVHTDILDVSSVPWQYRWTLREPDGTTSYLDKDGSVIASGTAAWFDNELWEQANWREQQMSLTLDQLGVYVLTFEALYSNPEYPNLDYTLTTRHVLYVPSIEAEVALTLPAALQSADDIMFDSDGRLWIKSSDDVLLTDIFYDYFMVDYESRTVWLRENYSSVRVVP